MAVLKQRDSVCNPKVVTNIECQHSSCDEFADAESIHSTPQTVHIICSIQIMDSWHGAKAGSSNAQLG